MKIIEHVDKISRTVNNGKVVEVIGLGQTVKNLTMRGKNVSKRAYVPAGTVVGYTLRAEDDDQTTLIIVYHRPGQIYETTRTMDKPLEEAAEYWGLKDFID